MKHALAPAQNTRSSLKSDARHVFKSRMGVSGIIGAVLLATVIMLAMNTAAWYSAQQSNFIALNRARHQLGQQASLERFQVPKITIPSQGFNATIQNIGIVSIHIVDIIITQRTSSIWHRFYGVNYYINPGAMVSNVGLNIPATLDQQQTYTIAFVTERGTRLITTYSPNQLLMGDYATFGNVGYLSINFDQASFQYTSQSQPTSASAWTPSSHGACNTGIGKGPLYAIIFVNHGTYDAIVQKWSIAQLWLMQSQVGGGGVAQDFYIVAPSSTPGNLGAYTNGAVTVPKSATGDWETGGTPTTILFGANSMGGTNGQNLADCDVGSIYDFFIVVSYLYNGQQFNQVVPYAASIITS